ncbi:MAG TPA: phosphatase PAP2 family protein [Actinomycetota bacterium]|nr:phosphatase PAP2 family protein [Actinomycetota bacterium]
MKRRWFPAVAGLGALGIAVVTARGRGKALDRRLYSVANRGRGRIPDALFKSTTELGSIWASGAAAVTLAVHRRRREALDAFGAALTMWALGQVLKKAIGRPRPYAALQDFRLLIDKPRGTTWPSSHPAVVLAFVTVAGRDLELCPAAKVGVIAVPLLVGVSRVYLGVHFPADVAGGLLLGRAVADVWSSLVSPGVLGRDPSIRAPVQ